jgi:hypothetical protein
MRSLAERLQAYEQKKARLANMEASLKLAEKKARTRRLLNIGELAEKAGIADLAEDALYGALLSLDRDNATQLRRWAAEGQQALARDKEEASSGQPVLLLFHNQPSREEASALRSSGFRFNRVLRHWEGFATLDDAKQLAESYGGTAQAYTV